MLAKKYAIKALLELLQNESVKLTKYFLKIGLIQPFHKKRACLGLYGVERRGILQHSQGTRPVRCS